MRMVQLDNFKQEALSANLRFKMFLNRGY